MLSAAGAAANNRSGSGSSGGGVSLDEPPQATALQSTSQGTMEANTCDTHRGE